VQESVVIHRLLVVLAVIAIAGDSAVAQLRASVDRSAREIEGLYPPAPPAYRIAFACSSKTFIDVPCLGRKLRPASGSASAGLRMLAGVVNDQFDFVQGSMSWGALGSGYAGDKLMVFIVTRYATREAARRAAIQECARRQLTECQIPIVDSNTCYSVVRNADRTWFQAGLDAEKLTADLLRQCREEGRGSDSACYVEQTVCTDF